MTMTQPTTRVPAFSIGDRLRKARQTMDGAPDVRLFADMLGVSHGTVTRYELEQTPPERMRPIVLHAWAELTGVDEQWLKTGEGPASDADGASPDEARPEGLEPPTFCSGAASGPETPSADLPSVAAPMILLAGLVTAAMEQVNAR